MGGNARGWAAAAGVALAACGAPAPVPEAPGPAGSGLVPRHWDQVCTAQREAPAAVRISELFDTAGLGETLARIGVEPLPLAPPWPTYDFITRYDARGRPLASGTWDATVDPEVARELETELKTRVRPLSGLLEATGFRSQVVFARRIAFGVAGPVTCIPHMVHEEGKRPTGLPEGVNTWGGSSRVRPGDLHNAVVRIHVDAAGKVVGVEDVAGEAETLARVRAVIPLLRFDPALSNGVAVEGVLLQGFYFRQASGG